jgi:hypothetical protein
VSNVSECLDGRRTEEEDGGMCNPIKEFFTP